MSVNPVSPESLERHIDEQKKIQPVGIRRINLKRTRHRLFPMRPKDEVISLVSLIAEIITRDNQSRDGKKKARLTRVNIVWNPQAHNGYYCLFYKMAVKGTNAIGRAAQELGAKGKDFEEISVSSLWFLYRDEPRQVFALSQRQMWNVVRPYTDYSWPIRFAWHFLDPKKIKGAKKDMIVGDARRVETTYPEGVRLQRLNARDGVFAEVDMHFRELELDTISISGESDVESRDDQSEDSNIVTFRGNPIVKMQTGQIRIERKFKFGDFPRLLDRFSSRMTEDVPQKIRDQFEVFDYLVKVDDYEEVDALERVVLGLLADEILGVKECCLTLCHKNVTDFVMSAAQSFTLKYNRRSYTVPRNAKLKDVLRLLKSILIGSRERIIEELKHVKLSYQDSGAKPSSLLGYIEGELRIPKGAFFRIHSCFYRLSGDYLAYVHTDFRRSLHELLMPENDPGQLPLSWGGHTKHGLLSKAKVSKAPFNLFKNKKVSYLSLSEGGYGRVKFEKLRGEILLNPLVRTHQIAIEALLKSKNRFMKNTLEKTLNVNGTAAKEVWDALTQDREVIKGSGDQFYVANPLEDGELETKLAQLSLDHYSKEKEGSYNERYLDLDGFIVGDRVCPFGIEIFDLVKSTDSTTYIYHVKEGFDLHARDALDQVLNSVEMIMDARYAETKHNVLDEWYRKATHPEPSKSTSDQQYRKTLSEKMKQMTLKKFKELFLERKLVVVYAVLDKSSSEKRLIDETRLQDRFTQGDFLNVLRGVEKTEEKAKEIFAELQKKGYLDRRGRIGSTFYATSKNRFEKDCAVNLNTATIGRIYNAIRSQTSQFNSTIALLSLRRAREQLRHYNIDFKICQIKRPSLANENGGASLDDNAIAQFDVLDTNPIVDTVTGMEFERKNYSPVVPTRGDGACALHALNANQVVDGYNTFVPIPCDNPDQHGRNAKQEFLTKLVASRDQVQAQLLDCLKEFVRERDNLWNGLLQVRQQFQARKEQAQANYLNACLSILNDDDLYNQVVASLRDDKSKYKTMSQEALKVFFRNNPEACAKAFSASRDEVEDIVPLDHPFNAAVQELAQVEVELEDESKRYYLSLIENETYQNTVLEGGYYLSNKELTLAAILYEKTVVLFSAEQVEILNDGKDERVFIRHDGALRGHYTRLTAQE